MLEDFYDCVYIYDDVDKLADALVKNYVENMVECGIMPVKYVDVNNEEHCPYCKKFIKPIIRRENDELRLICPKCKLTIEVRKFKRR